MAATLTAARACACTVLFHNLRVHAFRGAVPHVMLVVDAQPGVLQKVLIDGYVHVLNAYNNSNNTPDRPPMPPDVNHLVLPSSLPSPQHDSNDDKQHHRSSDDDDAMPRRLFMSLRPAARAPCGGDVCVGATVVDTTTTDGRGADDATRECAAPCISYTIMPFDATSFMDDVHELQAFLRQCGSGGGAVASAAPAHDDEDKRAATTSNAYAHFCDAFARVYKYLRPLCNDNDSDDSDDNDDRHRGAAARALCEALWRGPMRELLGFVLIQRSAFQNEMKRYRLRLGLFDLGMRVAEHCHLESMSAPADARVVAAAAAVDTHTHANSGDDDDAEVARVAAALCDDQVFTYARACALPPRVVETLAKAIADAIDVQAWQRASLALSCVRPPPSLAAAQASEAVWAMFRRGALVWSGSEDNKTTAAHDNDNDNDDAAAAFQRTLRLPVTAAGAPLRIVCRDAHKVLTFAGGLEDCLMNTGYYAAADDAARNDVHTHRRLFALARRATTTDATTTDATMTRGDNAGVDEAPPLHGRLKKQDYLALKRRQRQQQADDTTASDNNNNNNDSNKHDHDAAAAMAEGVTSSRAPAGSCMSSSIGGTFPIGEVISESFDLSALSGTCDVFAYPDPLKCVAMCTPRPFTMTIERGVVTRVSDDAPRDVVELLDMVRDAEGACYVRELGIGLNPYVSRTHVLHDVTSFERQWGVHLSLGQRHPLFVKQRAKRNADGSVAAGVHVHGPVLKRKAGKYHIDVFVDAAAITMGALTLDFTHGVAVS